jgi:transcriptional regulator with XRE-family HTH domain
LPPRRSLPEGLDKYRVGPKVRRLRLRKKISLEELGRHTRLSPALLSKLERGQVMPTLPTLMRIAPVFGIGLEEFFVADPAPAAVLRASERIRLPEIDDAGESAFDFESLNFSADGREMNAYLAEFRPADGITHVHSHDAAEFLVVTAGRLVVRVEDTDHVLGEGDSIYINPSVPHGYARQGESRCTAIVVTTAAPGAAMTAPVRTGSRLTREG